MALPILAAAGALLRASTRSIGRSLLRDVPDTVADKLAGELRAQLLSAVKPLTTFKVETNFPEVRAKVARLGEDVRNVVIPRALKRIGDRAAVEARRSITARYALKAGEVRQRLAVRRAGGDPFAVELVASGKRGLNVIRFLTGGGRRIQASQARRKLKAGPKAQLQVRIKKGAAKPLPGAFVANQGRTVFRRVGKARFPIEAVSTIDVPGMFSARDVDAQIREFIAREWPAVFEREMQYALRRFGS